MAGLRQRVFGPHLKTIPAEHAPEEMSQTIDSARDPARRSAGFERTDVGEAPRREATRGHEGPGADIRQGTPTCDDL